MLPWREHDDPHKGTRYSLDYFPHSTDYLDRSHAPFMINYIVDDLDAFLDRRSCGLTHEITWQRRFAAITRKPSAPAWS